jgi:DNA-directed RNA polymerase specialized sigma24 family protein
MTRDDGAEPVREVYVWDHERLWRSIFAYRGSAAGADDAVAEAFADALRRGAGVRDVTTWVWRQAFVSARELPDDSPVTGGGAEPALTRVFEALARLDDDDRRLLAWCHVGGWSPQEVAPLLGVRPATARRRLRRATDRFQALLEPAADGDGAGSVTDALGPVTRMPVPERWEDVVARAERLGGDDRRSPRGSRRPVVVLVTVVAVLVGVLVVVSLV